MREEKGRDFCEEDLGRIEGGKNIIRLYCIKTYFQIKTYITRYNIIYKLCIKRKRKKMYRHTLKRSMIGKINS